MRKNRAFWGPSSTPLTEGEAVAQGDQLGKLDDRQTRLLESQARTKLSIATEKAENGLAEDLARKKLAEHVFIG